MKIYTKISEPHEYPHKPYNYSWQYFLRITKRKVLDEPKVLKSGRAKCTGGP